MGRTTKEGRREKVSEPEDQRLARLERRRVVDKARREKEKAAKAASLESNTGTVAETPTSDLVISAEVPEATELITSPAATPLGPTPADPQPVAPVEPPEKTDSKTGSGKGRRDDDPRDRNLRKSERSEAVDYSKPKNNLGRVLSFSTVILDEPTNTVLVPVAVEGAEVIEVQIIYPEFDKFDVKNHADAPYLGQQKIRIVGVTEAAESKDGKVHYRAILEKWRENFVAEQARVEEENDQYLPGDRIHNVSLVLNPSRRAPSRFFVERERNDKKERLYIQAGASSIPDPADPTALSGQYDIEVLSCAGTKIEQDGVPVTLYQAMIVEKTDPTSIETKYDAETLKRELHTKKDADRVDQIRKLPRKKSDFPAPDRIIADNNIYFTVNIGSKDDELNGYFIHEGNNKFLAVRSLLNLLDSQSGQRLEFFPSAEVAVLGELGKKREGRPVFEGVFQHDVEFIGYVRSYEEILRSHEGILRYIDTLTLDEVPGDAQKTLIRSIQKKRSNMMRIVSEMGKGMRGSRVLREFLDDFRSNSVELNIALSTAEQQFGSKINTVEQAEHHEDDLFLFELGAYERRHPSPSIEVMHQRRLDLYKQLIDNEVQRKPGTRLAYQALQAEIAQRNHESDMGRHGRIRGLLAWAKAYAERFPRMFDAQPASVDAEAEKPVAAAVSKAEADNSAGVVEAPKVEVTAPAPGPALAGSAVEAAEAVSPPTVEKVETPATPTAQALFTEKDFDPAIDNGFEDGTTILVQIPGFGYELDGQMVRPDYLVITYFDDASGQMQATPYFNGVPADRPIAFTYSSLEAFSQIRAVTEAEVLTVKTVVPEPEAAPAPVAVEAPSVDSFESDASFVAPEVKERLQDQIKELAARLSRLGVSVTEDILLQSAILRRSPSLEGGDHVSCRITFDSPRNIPLPEALKVKDESNSDIYEGPVFINSLVMYNIDNVKSIDAWIIGLSDANGEQRVMSVSIVELEKLINAKQLPAEYDASGLRLVDSTSRIATASEADRNAKNFWGDDDSSESGWSTAADAAEAPVDVNESEVSEDKKAELRAKMEEVFQRLKALGVVVGDVQSLLENAIFRTSGVYSGGYIYLHSLGNQNLQISLPRAIERQADASAAHRFEGVLTINSLFLGSGEDVADCEMQLDSDQSSWEFRLSELEDLITNGNISESLERWGFRFVESDSAAPAEVAAPVKTEAPKKPDAVAAVPSLESILPAGKTIDRYVAELRPRAAEIKKMITDTLGMWQMIRLAGRTGELQALVPELTELLDRVTVAKKAIRDKRKRTDSDPEIITAHTAELQFVQELSQLFSDQGIRGIAASADTVNNFIDKKLPVLKGKAKKIVESYDAITRTMK